MNDRASNTTQLSFMPEKRKLQLFNGFVQDQITLLPDKLGLTVGAKLLHNDYTGFEWQPNVRVAFMPHINHTVWAAVSRAVRTPSRFDADEVTPFITTIEGTFRSENVITYEAGYRIQPTGMISLSLATFYNRYDDLRSININPNQPPVYLFANDQKAQSWGFELSANVFPRYWWQLRGGYIFLKKKFTAKSTSVVEGSDLFEALDPGNQVIVQSIMTLPANIQLDISGRYVEMLPVSAVTPAVPSYMNFDVRLAWTYKRFTFSVSGQNLASGHQQEFGYLSIPRSIYQTISFRL